MAEKRLGDVLYNVVDEYTGEWLTYKKVTKDVDGTALTDANADGTIIIKRVTDGLPEYFRQVIEGPVNVKKFGAIGDGASHPISDFFTSLTDARIVYPTATAMSDEIDGLAIQKAVDFVLYFNNSKNKRVQIPAGNYLFTNFCHLGYGNLFRSIEIVGDSDAFNYRAESQFKGTCLISKVSNQGIFNVAGARIVKIKNLAFKGLNFNYAQANVGDLNISVRNPANYVDPALSVNADSRYAPYAAITIDAFSGNTPAQTYATQTFPAYSGAGQYGRNAYSSDVVVENCYIGGFVAGMVCRPSDSDGNGDFISAKHCMIEFVKYGVSIGNSQARLSSFTDINFNSTYINFTTSIHGRQNGKIHKVDNCHFVGFKAFHILNGSVNGPLLVTNCYSESMARIGDFKGRANALFQSCHFEFQDTDARTAEKYHIDNDDTGFVEFKNSTFNLYKTFVVRTLGGISFDENCRFAFNKLGAEPAGVDIANTTSARWKMYNFWRGGVIGGFASLLKIGGYAVDSNNTGLRDGDFSPIVRAAYGAPIRLTVDSATKKMWSNGFSETGTTYIKELTHFSHRDGVYSTNNLDTVTLSGRILTLTSASNYWKEILFNIGSTLYFRDEGLVFLVESIAGNVATCVLMNNYYTDNAGAFVGYLETVDTTIFTKAGDRTFIFNNPNQFTFAKKIFGDVTLNSTLVTNIRDAAGNDMTPQFQDGDWLWSHETAGDQIGAERPFKYLARVQSRDLTNKTLTLTQSALITKVGVELFNSK